MFVTPVHTGVSAHITYGHKKGQAKYDMVWVVGRSDISTTSPPAKEMERCPLQETIFKPEAT
jgi:hypothetical protein